MVEAGFPADDVIVVEGKVYVGRDAEVTLAASREMLETDGTTKEQYHTKNVVSRSLSKICINGSTFTGAFSAALDMAIQNYDAMDLTFSMARTPSTDCSFTINAVIDPSMNGGSAGFPSNGNPYGQITIGGQLSQFGVNVIAHVITHEIGHTLGFRHADYYNRSISCGVGGNEGEADVGAIAIQGTSTTANVGGSVMNSCFRAVETGRWLTGDPEALLALFKPREANPAVCVGNTVFFQDWHQLDNNTIYADVSTVKCGYSETPLYFTSLGGAVGHMAASGVTAIYSPSSAGFRVYLKTAVSAYYASLYGWHIKWQAVRKNLRSSALCSGETYWASTPWQQVDNNRISLDVDTAACGFTETPLYFTSLGGAAGHRDAKGSEAISVPTPTGFRVYLTTTVSATRANMYSWHIKWQAAAKDLRGPDLCTGQTQQGATAWQQAEANVIYLDVNTAPCGLGYSTHYFTSIGGLAAHGSSSGATAIYSPTDTGFRIYVTLPSMTATDANLHGWYINWSANRLLYW
ncbi:M57 family metalloprotease [Corallococcus caeni]|uniref:M57 family metalloprotease n=1 Tax=Corallococcus caeni TaxID=3082388 RepID=UPI0030C7003D